ncbi:scyllo-inositol 2-dehydrogenase (NADP(+)) [termite gut metagenome]|uniref:Scyllo-inositol 2-dehydrogenase (NADP(+)) n=1 Tax=termite gut metagenome TaxID=433724 RepID=A0A5J4SCQ8_9ZZZZ
MKSDSKGIINTGLLAYGMSGRVFHAPFLDKHTGFNLYAVTERNTKKAQKEYPYLISYNSVDELLNDDAIELVVVNTPNNLHYEQAKSALLKGKHILVEKPFTATTKQAKELFELADKQGKEVFFYQNRRWDSDFISVKKVIDSGRLGKPNEIHIRYDRYRPVISLKAFKETPTLEACGLFYDLGPHLLDQVISLFGKPVSYHKVSGSNRKNTQVEDYFMIQLSYPNDLNVTVTASLLVADAQPAFVLHGVEGSFVKYRADVQEEQLLAGMKLSDPAYGIELPGMQGILSVADKNGTVTKETVASKHGNYLSLFDAVYQTLVNRKTYPITREEILTQLEILEH